MPEKNKKGAAPVTATDLLNSFSQFPSDAPAEPLPRVRYRDIQQQPNFSSVPTRAKEDYLEQQAQLLTQAALAKKERDRQRVQEFAAAEQSKRKQQQDEDAAFDQKAWEDARATHPGVPDEQLVGFQKLRASALRTQIKSTEDELLSKVDNKWFRTVAGLAPTGANAAPLTQRKEGQGFALGYHKGMDMSFVYDDKGDVKPEFIKQVVKMTGGDQRKFKDAANAIIEGKVAEYDAAPSIGAEVWQAALDYTHKVPVVGSAAYYALSGATAGTKAAMRTGITLGHVFSTAFHGLAGDLAEYDHKNHYGKTLEDIESIPDRAAGEEKLSMETFMNNPFNGIDALLGESARFGGEMEALGPLGRAVGRPITGAVEKAGLGSSVANTAANRVYPAYAKILDNLGTSRIPGYLDNVLSTGAMFAPSMFGNYYADALRKGYSPEQANNVALQHTSLAIPLMAIGNLAGTNRANKLPQEILDAIDREAAGTFLGKARQMAAQGLRMTDPKEAAKAGIGMGASAFADAYQEHQEAIERGEIDPNTPFNAGDAIEHAVQAGVVGALTTGVLHLANGHGSLVETPQAMAIYQAAQKPTEFYQAVDRQVARNKIAPEQAHALKEYVNLITERRDGKASLLEQGFTQVGKNPAAAVKWATEQARLQEVAETIAELSAQTNVVNTVDAEGNSRDIIYGLDPATGEYTEAAGREIQGRIDALNSKAQASERAITQLKDGMYLQGRTIKGDEMLRLTSRATPEGRLSTEQAARIIGEGPYTSDIVDILPYAEDAIVKEYMEKGMPEFSRQHANDPVLGADGTIIDGRKRIADALKNGLTAMPVVRPVGVAETAQHAQESRDNIVGADEIIVEGLSPEGVELLTEAREAYERGLDREETAVDVQMGLSNSAIRALHDAAEVLKQANAPKEEMVDMLNRVTGGHTSPAVADHVTNLSLGSRPAEAAPERIAEPQEVAPTAEVVSPTLQKSVLWDREAGKLREDITPTEVEDYLLMGDVPERYRPAAEASPTELSGKEWFDELAKIDPMDQSPENAQRVNELRQNLPEGIRPEDVNTLLAMRGDYSEVPAYQHAVRQASPEAAAEVTPEAVEPARQEAQKIDFTTKSGNRVFVNENGRMEVLNKDGQPVSESTRRRAMLEAAENHDFTTGEITIPEGANDREMEQHVAERSNNPAELAVVWLHAEREGELLSGVEEAIMRNGIKTTTQSFDQFGDKNWRTIGIAKSYINDGSKDNSANKQRGESLDVIAKEISDHDGIEVTPQDLIDFMVRYPNGISQAEHTYLSPAAELAAQRFNELTGFELNEKIPTTKKIAEIALAQFEGRYTPGEKTFLKSILENEYITREQEELAYNRAVEEGLIRPGEEGDAGDGNNQGPRQAEGDAIGQGRPEAEAGANELDAGRAGEQAPVIRRGQANILVPESKLESVGWSEDGVRTLYSRLQDMFGRVSFEGRGVTVAVIDNAQMQRMSGRPEGFLPDASYLDGVIYINVEHPSVRPSSALHESGHMWVQWANKNAGELYSRGLELAQETAEYKHAIAVVEGRQSDGFGLDAAAQKKWTRYALTYAEHSDARLSLADEVIAQGIQSHGRNLSKADFRTKFQEWLQDLWDAVKGATGFRDVTARKLADMKYEDFIKRVTEELSSGKALTRTLMEEMAPPKVNERRAERVLDAEAEEVDPSLAIGVEGRQLEMEREQAAAGANGKPPTPIEERIAKDPLINTLGRVGASGIISHWQAAYKGLYKYAMKELAKVSDTPLATLENALLRPSEVSAEVRKVLGISLQGGRVVKLKGDSIAEAIFSKAAETFGQAGKKYSAEEVAFALKRSAEIADENEVQHQKRVAVGKENQIAGLDTGRGTAEDALITELESVMDTFQSTSRLRAWAREKGITEKEAKDLITKALNRRVQDTMYSLPEGDERQAVRELIEDLSAETDLNVFADKAREIVRSAFHEGFINREEAGKLVVSAEIARTPKLKDAFISEAREVLKFESEQPVEQSAPEPTATGIRNKVVDEERAKRGLSPAMKNAAKELGETWQESLAVLERDPTAGDKLLDELRKNIKPLTDVENGLLLHKQITAQTEENRLMSDVNELTRLGDVLEITAKKARLAEVQAELKDIYDLGRAAGTANSRGLNTRRLMAKEDFNLAAMESRKEAAQGKPLTEKQRAEIGKLHEEIKRLEIENEALAKKAEAAAKKKSVTKKVEEVKVEAKKKPSGNTSSARLSVLERMRQRRAGTKDAMFSLPEGLEGEYEPLLTKEDAKDIRELMKVAAEEGIVEVDAMLDRIYMDLADFIPNLTRSEVLDVMSEYGKTREPSKDEVAKTLREVKTQGRLIAAYRDALNQEAPKKSGFQPGKPSDKVRELQRQVRAAIEEAGIVVTDPTKQLASRLEATKNLLRNRISDLNKAILSKERIAKTDKPLALDTEGLALRAQRDQLQGEYNTIFGKKGLTDEQRVAMATKAVERSIKELERRIEQGDTKPSRTISKTPETPELKKLREDREALQKKYDDLKKATNPPKSKEQLATEAALRSAQKTIEDLERRIQGNDLATPKKTSLVQNTTELIAARDKRDMLRERLDEMKRKANPPKTAEEKATDAAIRAAEKRIDELRRRIAEGDLEPAKKPSKVQDTPELTGLRSERDRLQEQLDDLKEAAKPVRDPFEVALESYEKRINKRIAEYEERMQTGNFAPKDRTTIDLGQEGMKLSLALERKKYEYEVMLEKDRMAQRTNWQKAKDMTWEVANIPKGLVSTADLSAPLRQGLVLSTGNPIEAGKAFVTMLKHAVSKDASDMWLHALHQSEIYPLMRQSDLYIAEPSAKLTAREESFASRIPKKIPGYNILYGASERAYVGFLNKIRADVFAKGVDHLLEQGMTFRTHPAEYKAWAEFINNASGRGKLGKLENAAPILNAAFFAPRLVASRLNLMNPVKYAQMPPEARKMALQNVLSFIAFGSAVLTIAALAGADTEADPRSADFGKIRIGDTRYDIWTGFLPIIRTIVQIATNQRKNSATGDISEIDKEQFFADTPLWRFGRTKLAPVPGALVNLHKGKTVVGEEVTPGGEAMRLITPLLVQDIYEILSNPNEKPTVGGIASTAIPAFFGVGVQKYSK